MEKYLPAGPHIGEILEEVIIKNNSFYIPVPSHNNKKHLGTFSSFFFLLKRFSHYLGILYNSGRPSLLLHTITKYSFQRYNTIARVLKIDPTVVNPARIVPCADVKVAEQVRASTRRLWDPERRDSLFTHCLLIWFFIGREIIEVFQERKVLIYYSVY